jgi:Uma2 family endonuclease
VSTVSRPQSGRPRKSPAKGTVEDPEGLTVCVPASAGSFAGFREWATSDEFPERLRASFIDKEIHLDMSPEEFETHNKIKAEVTRAVINLNEDLDLGEFFSDRALVTNTAAELSTEPDASFVLWSSFVAGRVQLKPRKDRPKEYVELVGTPDWVLEIVSRYSVAKDTKLLRDAYHRAGVREYWLIDARFEEVSFQILRWRRDRYVSVTARGKWRRSGVFGRNFALRRSKNRMGRWQYKLEVSE